MGREFAVQLAEAGLNVALVARRKPLLDEVAAQLSQRNVAVRVLPFDLARADAVTAIRAQLATEGVRVRLLCNNAAFGRWGRFEAADAATYQDMVQVNVGAVVALCHHFLPDLALFPSSAIINVSSPAALQPVPYMAVYAATKAFVHSLSQALYGEWQDRGVLVQCFVPGPTATEFDRLAGAYDSALAAKRADAAHVVRDAIKHLAKGAPVVRTAKGTRRQQMFAALSPPKVVISTVARMFRPPDDKR